MQEEEAESITDFIYGNLRYKVKYINTNLTVVQFQIQIYTT